MSRMTDREFQRFVERFPGWRVVGKTRNSHYRIVHENGAIVFAASTPSDRRSIKNLQADLRRLGRIGRQQCSG